MARSSGAPTIPKIISLFWNFGFLVCWFGFFASITYFTYLSRHSPSAPAAVTGQVVELNKHGSLFYVRSVDAILAQSGFGFVAVALVGGLLLRLRFGRIPEVSSTKTLKVLWVLAFLAIPKSWIFM